MGARTPVHLTAEQDVLRTIYGRRTIRAYDPELLDKALIGELLDAAVQAPTGMHLEPWAFAVIQGKTLLQRWSDRAKTLPSGAALPEGNIFYDATTLIVICRTVQGPFAEADCWLAAQNLMLAATAKGLGTCCVGHAIPVFNTPCARRDLGIPDEGAAVAPIIVGVPNRAVPPVPRKPPRVLRWLEK